jgi:hypothetical protein
MRKLLSAISATIKYYLLYIWMFIYINRIGLAAAELQFIHAGIPRVHVGNARIYTMPNGAKVIFNGNSMDIKFRKDQYGHR